MLDYVELRSARTMLDYVELRSARTMLDYDELRSVNIIFISRSRTHD
jgi:hypothetical protein